MFNIFNLFKKEYGTGALLDVRPEKEKKKDFKFEEIVAGIDPVNWKEKSQSEWRRFPIFDQDQSGSCFPHDADVLMQDFNYKPISEIRIGDGVITHQGRIRKVTETFQRKWQGTTKIISLYGEDEPIEATAEHPFFAIKRTEGIQEKELNGTPDFYKAGDLKRGDWIALPLNNEIVRDTTIYDFENDPEFLWVLGLYLAEGSIDKYKVAFSLHKDETAFVERVKKAMGKYDTNVTCSEKIAGLGMQLGIFGKRWVEIFEELGGKYCDKKEINKRLMFLGPSLQMKIAKGFMDGDGHIDKEGRQTMVSTSLQLLKQIKIILLRNKIYSFLERRKERENRKPVWTLSYSKTSKSSFIKDKWCFVSIKNIKHSPTFAGGHVYNIEVEEDNSYIVKGVAVHNCVAMTLAKVLGITHQVNEGEWITFSPGFVYQQRPNKPGSGMAGIDSWEIARKTGILIEDLFPSQKKTDAQIDAYQVKDYEKEVAKIFRVKNYLVVPTKDIDTIASVIQKTNKAVMVWFYFKISEWQRNVPMVSDHTLLPHTTGVARHSVTAVDFTLYQGKKALIIDDSWGLTSGISGQRIITEDFFKARNFFAAYPINFKFAEGITPLPQHYFEKNLTFGQTNSDVVALQDALKWFGFFPTNTTSTGYYGSITAKAVLDWQKKFSVDTLAELERLQGKYFGPKSRKKMNDLL